MLLLPDLLAAPVCQRQRLAQAAHRMVLRWQVVLPEDRYILIQSPMQQHCFPPQQNTVESTYTSPSNVVALRAREPARKLKNAQSHDIAHLLAAGDRAWLHIFCFLGSEEHHAAQQS